MPAPEPPELGDGDDEGDVDLGLLGLMTTVYTFAEYFVTYPYDLVKTRQQMARPSSAASEMSTGAHLLEVHRQGGVRALYRGFGWSLLGGIPSEVVYYVGYTHAKEAMLLTPTGQANPSAVYLVAGALADLLSVFLSVPADVVSQRLQLQSSRTTTSPPPPGGVQVARHILRHEGIGGLWRGAGASLACYMPYSAVWWCTHEKAKVQLERRLGCDAEHPGMLALSGALAGVTSTAATNPLDVVKTRIQCLDKPAPLRAVLSGVLRESGWRGLYSGLMPRLLAAVPRSVCVVLAYERAITLCRREPPPAPASTTSAVPAAQRRPPGVGPSERRPV